MSGRARPGGSCRPVPPGHPQRGRLERIIACIRIDIQRIGRYNTFMCFKADFNTILEQEVLQMQTINQIIKFGICKHKND